MNLVVDLEVGVGVSILVIMLCLVDFCFEECVAYFNSGVLEILDGVDC